MVPAVAAHSDCQKSPDSPAGDEVADVLLPGDHRVGLEAGDVPAGVPEPLQHPGGFGRAPIP